MAAAASAASATEGLRRRVDTLRRVADPSHRDNSFISASGAPSPTEAAPPSPSPAPAAAQAEEPRPPRAAWGNASGGGDVEAGTANDVDTSANASRAQSPSPQPSPSVGGRFAFFKRRRKTHAAVREEAVTRPNHYNELLQQRRAALPWWKRAAFYMGCGSCLAPLVSMSDVGLSKEEIEQVKMMVPFDDNELNMLVNRFLDLDSDKDGTISHEEFRSMPQFAANPFVDRIFRIFDVKPDQKVTFMEFVSAVAVFSDRGAKADKVKFLFQIYDLDDDGVISREDLRGVLKCILPDSTDAADIDMLVVKTFDECDRDKDGVIDGKEFFEVVAATDVETKVRIKL